MLEVFADAAGASLNIGKTKIFGIGTWSGRAVWPIDNIHIEN